jgi:hypothetical protein
MHSTLVNKGEENLLQLQITVLKSWKQSSPTCLS